MKVIKWPWCCLLLLVGCQSETDRLREAEHRFMEIVAIPEPFQITSGSDTLLLPVLPVVETNNNAKDNVVQLQVLMQKIDPDKLEATDRQRLIMLRRAVADMASNGITAPVDQICMQVAKPFQQALQFNNPQLTQRFLEYIPEYFAEIEQRWQPLRSSKTMAVMQEAEKAFDTLGQLEKQSPGPKKELFQTARLAVKDYIGLCQSTLLATE